jgi:6-phosphogluconolactonase
MHHNDKQLNIFLKRKEKTKYMRRRFSILMSVVSITLALLLSSAWAAPNFGTPGVAASAKSVFYAADQDELFRYDVDVTSATLTLGGSTLLPSQIQYAWPSPLSQFLYIGASNQQTGNTLNAFRVDQTSGALVPHGQPTVLPERVINVTVDKDATHALVALVGSATMNVYRLTKNGEIGEKVAQPVQPDCGIYTHQVRVSPSGDTVFTVGRGNDPTDKKPEDLQIQGWYFDQGR